MKFFNRFLLIPVLTLVLIGLIELLSRFDWFTPSLALPFAALALGNYWGGVRSGLATAAIITGYAIYGAPFDASRSVQIGTAAFSIALAIGYLKRRAALSDTLNGNIRRVREALDLTRKLKNHWSDYSDQGRRRLVEDIEDKLGNLAALIWGWHSISQEIAQVKAAAVETRPLGELEE